MKTLLLVVASLLIITASTFAQKSNKLRVLCWSEQTEPREIYPTGISGALADHLKKQKGIEARTSQLSDADSGLSDEVLNNTDVLIWFGHRKHNDVPNEVVTRVVKHIRERGMGFIGLHSTHFAKPLKVALQATGSWSSYVNFAKPEQMWVVNPKHPIAKGIKDFTIPKTEIYTEPFDVPTPEAVIFEGTWETGHRNREVMVWTLDKGRFVYIRPGHEEYPIFFMPEMQKLIVNSVLWAGKKTNAEKELPLREAGPLPSAFGPYCEDYKAPEVIHQEQAAYTPEARQANINGIVRLLIDVNADGSRGRIKIVLGLPHGLSGSVISAAQKLVFKPATCRNKPIASKVFVEYQFRMMQ